MFLFDKKKKNLAKRGGGKGCRKDVCLQFTAKDEFYSTRILVYAREPKISSKINQILKSYKNIFLLNKAVYELNETFTKISDNTPSHRVSNSVPKFILSYHYFVSFLIEM